MQRPRLETFEDVQLVPFVADVLCNPFDFFSNRSVDTRCGYEMVDAR